MIRVIEASSDQELAKKVTEAINANALPFGDWEYRAGSFIVLAQDGTPSGPGGFRLVWGVSSQHITAVAQPLIAQGWLAFGSVKVVNGQYVQALSLGVPAGSGGGGGPVYAADIEDSTLLGRELLTAETQAVAHVALGGGAAGVNVYQYGTVAEIQTYLGIGGGGGSVTVDDITDAGLAGKAVLRATTAEVAKVALGVDRLVQGGLETILFGPSQTRYFTFTGGGLDWGVYDNTLARYLPLTVAAGGTGGNTPAAARTGLGAGATGSALFTAATAANARSMIGAGVAGGNIFMAASQYNARLAMGVGNTGDDLFLASTKAAANAVLGTAYEMRTYPLADSPIPGVGVDESTLRIHAGLVGEVRPTNSHSYIVHTDAVPRDAGMGNYDVPGLSLAITSGGENEVGIGSVRVYAGSAGISSVNNLTVRDNLAVLISTLRAQGGISRVGTQTIDIGSSALPFTNIYLANQPVVTSDVRDKDEMNAIPDEVLDAWGEVDFVQFRRKDGDRIHFGVVAQKVQEVFEKHGLDPFNYGLICLETWEDEPEELDSNGAVLTPARKAGNRYGVRYQECMILEAALMRRTVKRLQSGA